MKKRHFTRQQVEARCLEIHPNGAETETTHVTAVNLLIGMPFPIWHVEYMKFYKEGTQFEIKTELTDMYTEEQIGSRLVLLPISEKPLPTGCATVEEEDQWMKRPEVDQ